ncbi:hypothetical protein ACJX0J_009336, partial [Zea mays]
MDYGVVLHEIIHEIFGISLKKKCLTCANMSLTIYWLIASQKGDILWILKRKGKAYDKWGLGFENNERRTFLSTSMGLIEGLIPHIIERGCAMLQYADDTIIQTKRYMMISLLKKWTFTGNVFYGKDIVCLSKDQGGLGLETFDGLWQRIVKEKYTFSTDFVEKNFGESFDLSLNKEINVNEALTPVITKVKWLLNTKGYIVKSLYMFYRNKGAKVPYSVF